MCDGAIAQLTEARDLEAVLGIKNAAEAFVTYTRKWRAAAEAQNACRMVVLIAEAKIGAELKAAQDRGQVATQKAGRPISVRRADTSATTLSKIGITRQRASDFKKLAKAGPGVIQAEVQKANAEHRVVTRRSIIDAVKRHALGANADLPSPAKAREMSRQTGAAVLASDHHYHHHVDPDDRQAQLDWYEFSEPITKLADLAITTDRALKVMLPSQIERIRDPLAKALAWLTTFQERLYVQTS